MKRLDLRFVIAVGLSLFGVSCLMNSTMTSQTGIDQLIWSQIVRACGQPLIITPLSSVATSGIEPKQVGTASALFNMRRNLGGSIGIAILGTLQSVREKFHSSPIGESVSLGNPLTRDRIDQLSQLFSSRTYALTRKPKYQ